MHSIYVLELGNGKYYIRYTENLPARLKDHKRNKENCRLIYYESYGSRKKAQEREKKLKYHGSAWRALRSRIG